MNHQLPFLKVSTPIEELKGNGITDLEYVFLSPVFDSISKQGYKGNISIEDLKNSIPDGINVVALGGINRSNVDQLLSLPIFGIGLLGAIWMDDDPVNTFKEIAGIIEAYDPNP